MSTVFVAPREIVDTVYRASRVTGADSGVASLIGRAAMFATVQLGSDLSNVLDALRDGNTPTFGFGEVTAVETEAQKTDSVTRDLAVACTVADLAHAAFEACRRGVWIEMTCGDGVTRSPHEWLTTGLADLSIASLTARLAPAGVDLAERVDDRTRAAYEQGTPVPEAAWTELNALARAYLVEESIIDAAEAPTP